MAIRKDYNIFRFFSLLLKSTVVAKLYTINVIVINVVPFLHDQPFTDPFFSTSFLYLSLAQNSFEYNKLYIGQLPLSTTEPFIRDVICKYTEVKDIKYLFSYPESSRATLEAPLIASAMPSSWSRAPRISVRKPSKKSTNNSLTGKSISRSTMTGSSTCNKIKINLIIQTSNATVHNR